MLVPKTGNRKMGAIRIFVPTVLAVLRPSSVFFCALARHRFLFDSIDFDDCRDSLGIETPSYNHTRTHNVQTTLQNFARTRASYV